MAKKVFFIMFLCVACVGWVSAQKNAHKHVYTVVIDAGHGGKDPGAVGSFVYEKTLNLAVALETGKMIKEAYPEVKVVYTRDADVFLPLQARADTVNKYDADLFICIHTNSSESRQACGAETYILGTDKLEQNLDVAMRENSVIKLESDYETAYQGFDPNSIDSYIMFELMQNQYVDQSLQFASMVQKRFVEKLPMTDRGVRQAAYWVLLKSACPSVLIEMGFVSNPKEEKYLASEEGKYNIALSLFESFCSFYHKPPKTQPKPSTEPSQPKASNNKDQQKNNAKESDKTKNIPVAKNADVKKDTVALTPAQTAAKTVIENQPVVEPKKDTVVAETKKEEKKDTIPAKAEEKVTPKTQDKPSKTETKQPEVKTEPANETKTEIKTEPKPEQKVEVKKEPDMNAPVYVVQIMAIKAPLKDETPLKGYDCQYFIKDGWYKYYYGATNDKQEANQTLAKLKNVFPGCFITILPDSDQQNKK